MRQTVAEVAAGDGDDEAQMGEHELTRRFHIAVVVETLGQPDLFRLGKHRIAIRCLDVGIDIANRRGYGMRQGIGHGVCPPCMSKIILALAV